MPSVTGRVVRRCGHPTIREAMPPIRLTFQLRPVATGALCVVDDLTACDELGVIWIGCARFGRVAEPHRRRHSDQNQETEPPRGGRHRLPSDRKYLTSAAAARM